MGGKSKEMYALTHDILIAWNGMKNRIPKSMLDRKIGCLQSNRNGLTLIISDSHFAHGPK